MRTRGWLRDAGSTALAFGALLALPAPVGATFPGENGRIAFSSQTQQPLPPEFPQVVAASVDSVLPNGERRRTIHAYPPGEGNYREEIGYELEWSPDGRWLTFEFRADGSRIALLRHDGAGGVRLLPKLSLSDYGPTWSPTGRRIAFVATDECLDCRRIHTIRRDGTGMREVTFLAATSPAWSATGTLAFVNDDDVFGGPIENDGLYTVRPDGSRLKRVFRRYWGTGSSPDWSPNGRRIAFGARQHIFTMPAGGGKLRRLTPLSGPGGNSPSWSPDGRYVAFSSGWLERGPTYTVPRSAIYVVAARGGPARLVAESRYTLSSDGELVDWEIIGPPAWRPLRR